MTFCHSWPYMPLMSFVSLSHSCFFFFTSILNNCFPTFPTSFYKISLHCSYWPYIYQVCCKYFPLYTNCLSNFLKVFKHRCFCIVKSIFFFVISPPTFFLTLKNFISSNFRYIFTWFSSHLCFCLAHLRNYSVWYMVWDECLHFTLFFQIVCCHNHSLLCGISITIN